MSRKYKFRSQDNLHFVSFSVINWIDVFIRDEYRQIVLDSINHCVEHKGLEVYAWCLMTSHAHMIIGSHDKPMNYIMRDLKAFTSRKIKETIKEHPTESRRDWMVWMMERAGKYNSNNNDWQFWQQDNHPIELYTYEVTKQKLNYIHNNPVAAGFVAKQEDWLYSSATDYAGGKGLLDIILIE